MQQQHNYMVRICYCSLQEKNIPDSSELKYTQNQNHHQQKEAHFSFKTHL